MCTICSQLWVNHTKCVPYCSQLWVNHTKCSYNKLRVAYNNAYRRVLGFVKSDSASNVFVNNQVENFDAHNRHLILYRLRSRIQNSDNTIVVCLNDCFYIRSNNNNNNNKTGNLLHAISPLIQRNRVDIGGPRIRSHSTRCEIIIIIIIIMHLLSAVHPDSKRARRR